jgi:hypothetical protein
MKIAAFFWVLMPLGLASASLPNSPFSDAFWCLAIGYSESIYTTEHNSRVCGWLVVDCCFSWTAYC